MKKILLLFPLLLASATVRATDATSEKTAAKEQPLAALVSQAALNNVSTATQNNTGKTSEQVKVAEEQFKKNNQTKEPEIVITPQEYVGAPARRFGNPQQFYRPRVPKEDLPEEDSLFPLSPDEEKPWRAMLGSKLLIS